MCRWTDSRDDVVGAFTTSSGGDENAVLVVDDTFALGGVWFNLLQLYYSVQERIEMHFSMIVIYDDMTCCHGGGISTKKIDSKIKAPAQTRKTPYSNHTSDKRSETHLPMLTCF